MEYTYTVRPMSSKIPVPGHPYAYEIKSEGCVVTIRDSHSRVVQQFPRMPNERVGHRLAQLNISRLKGK